MPLVPMVVKPAPTAQPLVGRGERSFDISRGLRPLTVGFADLTPG